MSVRTSGDSVRWQVVHGELLGLVARRAALDAEEARWLREAEALQIWRPLGAVSMLDYMERELHYAPQVARTRLRVARALGGLPQLSAALERGELAFSTVKELVRVATRHTEQAWRDAVRGKSVREVEQLVAARRPGDLPDDPRDETARLHTVTFEEVDAAAFAMIREARLRLDEEHGTRMSDADVVRALAASVLDLRNSVDAYVGEGDSVDDDVHHDDVARNQGAHRDRAAGRARNQIAYTICECCERATQNGAGVPVPVDAATVEQALCDAQHIGSIRAAAETGSMPAPGRARQDIPPRVVRFVFARDQHRCATPGCRSARGLEIHHIVPRSRGGTHDPANLTLRCGACHRAHHTGLLEISGRAPDALVTKRVAADAYRTSPRVELGDQGSNHVGRPDGVARGEAGGRVPVSAVRVVVNTGPRRTVESRNRGAKFDAVVRAVRQRRASRGRADSVSSAGAIHLTSLRDRSLGRAHVDHRGAEDEHGADHRGTEDEHGAAHVSHRGAGVQLDAAHVNHRGAGVQLDAAHVDHCGAVAHVNHRGAGVQLDAAHVNHRGAGVQLDAAHVDHCGAAAHVDRDAAHVDHGAGVQLGAAHVDRDAAHVDHGAGVQLDVAHVDHRGAGVQLDAAHVDHRGAVQLDHRGANALSTGSGPSAAGGEGSSSRGPAGRGVPAREPTVDAQVYADAVAALRGLGWRAGIARKAVDDAVAVLAERGTLASLADLVRHALQLCPRVACVSQ